MEKTLYTTAQDFIKTITEAVDFFAKNNEAPVQIVIQASKFSVKKMDEAAQLVHELTKAYTVCNLSGLKKISANLFTVSIAGDVHG